MRKVRHLLHQEKFIDVSVALKSGLISWPGDPPVRIKRTKSIHKGEVCNVSMVSLGSHTGTHIDAPLHFFNKGVSIDQMPLDATMGPVRVIEIKDRESIKLAEISHYRIRQDSRVLFKTSNSRLWKSRTFKKEFVYLSQEAAQYLVKKKIRAVGIDYLSIGGYYTNSSSPETHRTLLEAGIWIIEGLNLSDVKEGRYTLICLPLRVFNSDGAPARAVLYSPELHDR
jgi:arylformamidase